MKRCTKCRRRKALSEFSFSGKYLRGECKNCHRKAVKRAYHAGGKAEKQQRYAKNRDDILWKVREKKYAISKVEYDAMLAAQKGRCAICRSVLTRPHVDHCHKTGKVRGLLCGFCNTGLGYFRDRPKFLASAIQYLKH